MHRWLCSLAVVAGLLVGPVAAGAQSAVGFRAGMRSSQLAVGQDLDALTTFAVGGYFGFGVSNRLAVQFEAEYGRRGGEGLRVSNGELDPAADPVKVEMDYLEFPILLRAGFPGERFLPSVFAGPYVGFMLDCVITPPEGTLRKCEVSGEAERFQPRGTEVGILAGMGLDFAIGENTVFIDARYTYGLLSIEAGSEAIDVRNNGFAISGGFAVPVGR
jgi:hypothetical protein